MEIITNCTILHNGESHPPDSILNLPKSEAQRLVKKGDAVPVSDGVEVRLLRAIQRRDGMAVAGIEIVVSPRQARKWIQAGLAVRVGPTHPFDDGDILGAELSVADSFKTLVLDHPDLRALFEVAIAVEAPLPRDRKFDLAKWTPDAVMTAFAAPPESEKVSSQAPSNPWKYASDNIYEIVRSRYGIKAGQWHDRKKLLVQWHLERCWSGLVVKYFERLRQGEWVGYGIVPGDPERKPREIAVGWWSDDGLICDVPGSRLLTKRKHKATGGEFRSITVRRADIGVDVPVSDEIAARDSGAGEEVSPPVVPDEELNTWSTVYNLVDDEWKCLPPDEQALIGQRGGKKIIADKIYNRIKGHFPDRKIAPSSVERELRNYLKDQKRSD